MSLYTKQGDDGMTGLIGGQRVLKNDPRVAAYGAVDETNAAIGLALSACDDASMVAMLSDIQRELFTLGTELATQEGHQPPLSMTPSLVQRLERWIDEAEAETPPLKHFVLPGGCEVSCRLHVARTAARRAEREIVGLSRTQRVAPTVIVYLNRLSDLLFALARLANHRSHVEDVLWIAGDRPE